MYIFQNAVNFGQDWEFFQSTGYYFFILQLFYKSLGDIVIVKKIQKIW